MKRAVIRLGVVWCARVPDGGRGAAQTTTTSETKKFQIISVDGNTARGEASGRHEGNGRAPTTSGSMSTERCCRCRN